MCMAYVHTGQTSAKKSVVVWALAIIDDHHRGDKSLTSTSGDRGNSHAHGYRS